MGDVELPYECFASRLKNAARYRPDQVWEGYH